MNIFQGIICTTLFLIPTSLLACLGGTNSGTITPTAAYQTQAINNGQYYIVNVSCGSTYNFTFCGNGGSAAWDTQLTIIDNSGTTELAYNDDFCGLQSDLTWTSTFTGTVQVLVSQYFCNNNGLSSGVLAYNMTPGTSNSSFTLSPICGGVASLITGDTGGTFSWNPSDPGDGSILNTSTGLITSGVPGSTYTLDYSVCGSTSTQSETVPTGDCWTLNGDASYINVGGDQCIELTAPVNNQTGCAWNGSQIDFSSSFTLSLDYYFGNNINGADGSTFTFQPSSSTACGIAGGQLGAGGLANALTIEFDTYDNDWPTHLYDMSCDHIAVEIDGNMQGPGAPLCGPVCAKAGGGNIDDGTTYPVEIIWNPVSQQLDIYFNNVLRLSCTHDFITNVFGTNMVYWGVTSATGGLTNQQYFCPQTVVLPTELSSFSSVCENETEHVVWVTESENRVSHFVVESTHDGVLYTPIGEIQAIGESQSPLTYELLVNSGSSQQTLYRLKMIDIDGAFQYSSLILGKQCGIVETTLLNGIFTDGKEISIELNEQVKCTLYNELGQMVYSKNDAQSKLILPTQSLSSGIYILKLDNGKGKLEVERIFVQ